MNPAREDTANAQATADALRRIMNNLANVKPSTPVRRASSAGPPSLRTTRRTPANQARTPGGQRLGSARRHIVVTPHGRAAQRELNQRRGFTPGKDRRRSGRQQRETPRDILRALSRKLAPKSERIIPTPEVQKTVNHKIQEDDFEDGPALPRPRFSLPLGDEDDDDSLIEPPKSAGFEDEDFTGHSIELPRRAISEQPLGRLSRGSFGSVSMSDVFAELNDVGDNYDSSYLAGRGRGFGDDDDHIDDYAELQGENTVTLRGFEFGRGRLSLGSGRESDIRLEALPGDDTTAEFVFNVPQRDESEEVPPEDELEDLIQQQIFEESQDIYDDPEDEENGGDVFPGDIEDAEEFGTVGLENNVQNLQGDISIQDSTMTELEIVVAEKRKVPRKKVKLSKHGIQYPSLPVGVVKKLAMTFARNAGNTKAKISKETLDAVMQATDWFFEQVSDDLGAYAKHAGRKTIDESDIVTLMARQRQTSATVTPFSLAQRHLPRELLQELRMAPPSKLNRGRRLGTVAEEDEY